MLSVSVIPPTPAEVQVTKSLPLGMLTAHALVYDCEGFFEHILQCLERRLAESGSERRIDKDGYEYWVLKPD